MHQKANTELRARQIQRFFIQNARNGPLPNAEKITIEDMRLATLIAPIYEQKGKSKLGYPRRWKRNGRSFNAVLWRFRTTAPKMLPEALAASEGATDLANLLADAKPSYGNISRDLDILCLEKLSFNYNENINMDQISCQPTQNEQGKVVTNTHEEAAVGLSETWTQTRLSRSSSVQTTTHGNTYPNPYSSVWFPQGRCR